MKIRKLKIGLLSCLLAIGLMAGCSDQAHLDEASATETFQEASTETSSETETSSAEEITEVASSSSEEEHTEFDPYYETTQPTYYPYVDPDGYPAPENWRELYPHGSAGKLEGTIAVISIFAEDAYGGWDETEQQNRATYARAYYDLRLACEYISAESAKYDKEVIFEWDWMKHPELCYEASFTDDNLANVLYDYGVIDEAVWKFIETYVDSEGIRKQYDASSVVYMLYVNSPSDANGPSCTRNFYYGMPYPYEICYIQMNQSNRETPPAVFAHEMLHTFGAPDLYWTDLYQNYRLEYGITKKYAQQIAKEGLNDLMRITWDAKTGKYLYHSISPEITDITAYYVGLIDHSDTVEKWGFDKSQHDQ